MSVKPRSKKFTTKKSISKVKENYKNNVETIQQKLAKGLDQDGNFVDKTLDPFAFNFAKNEFYNKDIQKQYEQEEVYKRNQKIKKFLKQNKSDKNIFRK